MCFNGAIEAWAVLEEEQQKELLLLGPSAGLQRPQAERRENRTRGGVIQGTRYCVEREVAA